MDTMLVRSWYKITQILRAGEEYATFVAVDIESREKTECLLNVYEGDLGRRFADGFEKLQHCPEYMGMFVTNGALVAVFKQKMVGNSIDDLFYKGARVDWKTRLGYAQKLIHLALSVWEYPPEIGCATFLTENLCVMRDGMQLSVNYSIPPINGANRRELIMLMSDQIRKVLAKRFAMSVKELDFLDKLHTYTSVPVLYSEWQDISRELAEEYERTDKMLWPLNWWHYTVRHVKRWFKKRFPRTKRRG